MDLHYSQTDKETAKQLAEFESPMDLHYSQTPDSLMFPDSRLNPLWIYTTLKHGQ